MGAGCPRWVRLGFRRSVFSPLVYPINPAGHHHGGAGECLEHRQQPPPTRGSGCVGAVVGSFQGGYQCAAGTAVDNQTLHVGSPVDRWIHWARRVAPLLVHAAEITCFAALAPRQLGGLAIWRLADSPARRQAATHGTSSHDCGIEGRGG